jgi:hypothetical protein
MIENDHPRRVDAVEVAKLIRANLKRQFPNIRFSVRTDRYAGGNSIIVKWTDGPTNSAVEEVTGGYAGARFDGMIDLQCSADSWFCQKHGARTAAIHGSGSEHEGPKRSRCCHRATLVKMGADYVETYRGLSPEFRAELENILSQRYGRPYDAHAIVDGEWMDLLLYRLQRQTPR